MKTCNKCGQTKSDRGKVLISTHEILLAMRARDSDSFTTRDIAHALAGDHQDTPAAQIEYAVRRGVAWLMSRGYVVIAKETEKRYTRAREPYLVTVYRRVDVMGECDCKLLNRIFLGVILS